MASTDDTILAGADGAAGGDAGGDAGGPAADSGEFIGEYRLVRKLGSGAMGEVHLARHGVTGQEVALKIITNRYASDEAFIKRFKREIAILLRLNHPNIGRAYAYGIDHERPFLAMEYINGPNLGDVLHERGALFEPDVLRLAIQIARGLAYAHTEAGLVHRDIKPANILLWQPTAGDRGGQLMLDGDLAKVIDFGLAKSIDAEDQRLTLTGIVMGTPAYMSPEQIRCDGDVDFHTDIYALGASMFHLLTGQVPFPGAAPAIIMTGHLTQPVPDPGALVPSLNPLTRKLVMTALAKQAKDRFVDYRGLINACEKAIKAIGTPEPGTARFLRKPLIRTNRAAEPTQAPVADDEDFVAHPGDADSRAINRAAGPKPPSTGTHVRKQLTVGQVKPPPPPPPKKDSDSSKHFRPSAADLSGSPALESHRPQGAPAAPATGSDALRKVFTDKVEKAKTTARFRKDQLKMQALDLEARRFNPGAAQLRLTDQLAASVPWLLLASVLIALMVFFIMQQH
jgi:serine/threonine protein kinase